MRQKIVSSLLASLEWRAYAFLITTAFLWVSTGELAFAVGNAFMLQIILYVAHSTWLYFRLGRQTGATLGE